MTGSEALQQVNQLITKGQFKEALEKLEQLEKGDVIAANDQLLVFLLRGTSRGVP